MLREGGLILLLTGVHAVGLGMLCGMLWLAFKADDGQSDEDDTGGGWGNDRPAPPDERDPDGGGLPLPDAEPARVRLRDHGRLGDRLPAPERRKTAEPERAPARDPA